MKPRETPWLFHGGRILDAPRAAAAKRGGATSYREAVLVRGERIEAVGSLDRLRREAGRGARLVNLRGGTLTKHYALTINLRKLAKDDAAFRAAMKQLPGFATRIPAQAWVDDRGFLRKLSLRLSLGKSPDGPVRMKLSEEFYGFGVATNIKAPPARFVTDAAKLLNR